MSPLDPKLLALLACPACKGALSVVTEGLSCPACAKTYPVKDGIPDLIP